MRIDGPEKPHGLRDVVAGVFAAVLGVQSEKNRERDFSQGSPQQFVLVGIGATVLFIVLIYVVVRVVLKFAGA